MIERLLYRPLLPLTATGPMNLFVRQLHNEKSFGGAVARLASDDIQESEDDARLAQCVTETIESRYPGSSIDHIFTQNTIKS